MKKVKFSKQIVFPWTMPYWECNSNPKLPYFVSCLVYNVQLNTSWVHVLMSPKHFHHRNYKYFPDLFVCTMPQWGVLLPLWATTLLQSSWGSMDATFFNKVFFSYFVCILSFIWSCPSSWASNVLQQLFNTPSFHCAIEIFGKKILLCFCHNHSTGPHWSSWMTLDLNDQTSWSFLGCY